MVGMKKNKIIYEFLIDSGFSTKTIDNLLDGIEYHIPKSNNKFCYEWFDEFRKNEILNLPENLPEIIPLLIFLKAVGDIIRNLNDNFQDLKTKYINNTGIQSATFERVRYIEEIINNLIIKKIETDWTKL